MVDRTFSQHRLPVRTVLAAGALTITATAFAAYGSPSGVRSGTTPTPSGTAAAQSPATATPGSSWVGVGELVLAKLDPSGGVSATPYQHTMLTASSSGTVQATVPMSGSGMRLLAGTKPPVTDSVAHFSLTPNGTSSENVRSDFAGKLPLAVKVSYALNKQPIQPSALAPTRKFLRKHYKSGTLQVTYVISNVSSEKTTVSFEGFNGAHVAETITDPIPLVAELKLTFPKDASDISAPGATLAAGKTGVKATWTLLLAPPLSGASKSISYSVKLKKAKAPEATVEAEVVWAQATLSGKVPQSAAAALGGVEGQPEQGSGGSAISLGQVNSDIGRPQRSANSRLESDKNALIKTHRSTEDRSLSKIRATVEQMTTTQADDEKNTVNVGNVQLSGLRDAGNEHLNGLQTSGNAQLNGLRGEGNTQLGQLRHIANHAVASVAREVATGSAKANANASAVLRRLIAELDSGTTTLRPLVTRQVAQLSAAAAIVDVLTMTTSVLRTMVDGLVTVVEQHATDASALDQLIVALIADANAFSPAAQGASDWRKLSGDLEAAKAKADLVQSAAAQIARRAADISTAAGKVHAASSQLKSDVHALSAQASAIQRTLASDVLATERKLESSIAHLSGAVSDFHAQIAAAKSRIGQATSSARASVGQATSNAQATIGQATSNAQSTIGKATDNAQAAFSAVGQKASADLAAGKESVQAAVQHARSTVQVALDKADSDYAQLLAVTQIAQAHQLPGGNATGVNVQNGAYVLRIADTG